MKPATTLGTVLFLSTAALEAPAQGEWPQFRGPDGLCVAKGRAIPTDFGPDKHVLWSTKIPGGHSSPCIDGDLIVLTGSESLAVDTVFAIDRKSGAMRWKRSFEHDEGQPQYFHVDGGPALSTACTDGEHFVAYLADYGLVVLDRAGELLWERRLPYPGFMFGVGPSPILIDDRIILTRDGAPEAAILALDVKDGSERWKVDRFDYMESHGTPFVWRNRDRDELVFGGTTRLTSLDPHSGDLLWQYDGTTVFPCTTATADADTLYYAAWSTGNSAGRSFWEAGFGRSLELSDEEIADVSILFERLDTDSDGHISFDEVPECRVKDAFGFLDRDQSGTWELEELVAGSQMEPAPGANIMVAVSRGADGQLEEKDLKWAWTRGLPYVASPLLHQERLWLFKAGGIVTCLDAETGEPIFGRSRLSDRSEYYLSPVGAGDVLLAGSAEGTLYVIDATADELSVLHSAVFDEELFATPAVVDGVVYLRSKETLWAFGQDPR